MFTPEQKAYISQEVQRILQKMDCDELPLGEIEFILHVDGEKIWSWANIRNGADKDKPVPEAIVQNLSY